MILVKKLILFIALLSNFSFAIIQELVNDTEIAEKQNFFFFESSVMAVYQQFNEEYIHSENNIDMKYSGFGPLIDFRVGVFIKGRVAFFGNIFFEITNGYYDGVVDEGNDETEKEHVK